MFSHAQRENPVEIQVHFLRYKSERNFYRLNIMALGSVHISIIGVVSSSHHSAASSYTQSIIMRRCTVYIDIKARM